ncbi:MAG: hypothetical protein R3Y09_07245 [Clostridia bacterium]
MREIKNENKYYVEHRVYGAYETRDLHWTVDNCGNRIQQIFEDTEIRQENGNVVAERQMDIGGKSFTVCSIFPITPTSTPTDKILKIIERDLEK